MAAGPKEDVFCRIWRGLERAYVAYKDDRVMVIMDLYPLERGQVLVVPREHFQFFYEMPKGLMEHFYLVSSATARALKELYKPKAVAMLARGLRVPHYHLILIPVREGSFVDRLFSLMDAVQGFPPVPPEVVAERYQGLGLSLRAYRPSYEELEVESGRLRELIAKELGRA
ncbi:MAG: HIT domain-containing protein [Acidilobus sp.]|nr:HIT domain-containing protein [Acidilobus sp.]